MAKVRIRKAGPGEKPGYYNKTSQFLKKAQLGMEMQEQPAQEEMLATYYQYAYGQLLNDVKPDKVYTALVSNGLPEEVAYTMITKLMDKLVDEGELNPDYKREREAAEEQQQQQQQGSSQMIEEDWDEELKPGSSSQEEDQAMYDEQEDMNQFEEDYLQDRSYMQDGGYTEDDYEGEAQLTSQYDDIKDNDQEVFDLNEMISQTPGIQPGLTFPSLEEYIPNYQGADWEPMEALQTSTLEEQKRGGAIKKKQFVKNVMALLKKQEGGEGEEDSEFKPLGKGNRMDTLTEDVQKHKNNFLTAIKTKATKVKTEEMYDKLRESEDPELQQLGMQNPFQVGGMTGGDNPLYRFISGGMDEEMEENPDYYEADFLPEAQKGQTVKRDGVEYYRENPYSYDQWYKDYSTDYPDLKSKSDSDKLNQYRQYLNFYYGDDQKSNNTVAETPKIPKATVRYVPNYISTPGTWHRNLTPWNPLVQRKRFAVQTSSPYYFGTNTFYKDPLSGMKPVARQVTKRGIFGRPKQWTDIYSPEGYNMENIKRDLEAQKSASKPSDKTKSEERSKSDKLKPYANAKVSMAERRAERNQNKLDRKPKLKKYLADLEIKHDLKKMTDMLKSRYDNGGITINDLNKPQPAPGNPDIVLGDQSKAVANLMQNPNSIMNTQQMPFSPPAPTSSAVQSYNTNPANNMITEPGQAGRDTSTCTEEQKRDTMSECYCSPEARKNPNDKRCYEGSGLIGVNYGTGKSTTVDPEAMVNVFNAGVRGITGLINRKDERAKEAAMYRKLQPENLYATQTTRHKGDWVDLGSQLGQYRFNQMGQDRSGFSSYGKYGGYMQDGGAYQYNEGDEVYMTDDDIRDFMANGGEIEYV